MGALEPPPPVADLDLQNLTLDQLAQLVTEVSPDVFYERAHAFDVIAARYEQVQDDLERETRNMWEAWSGRIAESFDELVRQVSGLTAAVLQAVSNPGYSAAMRRAGDALAQAQQRMRDLQAQNRRGDPEAARQVLVDLGTAYSDSGAMMSPMPDVVTGLPVAAGNRAVPKVSPEAEEQLVKSGQQHSVGGGEGRAGADLGSVAFASLAGHHRIGSGVIIPLEISPGTSGHEAVCAVPVVLGRGVPEASPKAMEQHGEQPRTEAAVVLGRSPRMASPVVHAASAKPKKVGTERLATAECDQNQQSRRGGADEQTMATSSGPSNHEAQTVEPLPVTSAAPAATTAAPSQAAAGPAPQTPVEPAALQTGHSAQLHNAGHFATAPSAGPASPAAVTTHGTAATAGVLATERALPPGAAVPPAAGQQDAELAGTPPIFPGTVGPLRPTGEHSATGGFMGAMFRGHQGHEHANERNPADFLGDETGAWDSGDAGAPVLGRAGNSPQPVAESELEDIEELKKIKDPEVLRLALGRIKQEREERDH